MNKDHKYNERFADFLKSILGKKKDDQLNRYVKQLENAFMYTIEVVNGRNFMTNISSGGHERQVSNIAVAIGKEMGFDESQLEGLRVSGRLHDIGNITIPEWILSGSFKLNPSEYAVVREHPLTGYAILKKVEFPWPVATVALQHHERMDGSGYPYGLRGEQILLESRIIAIADVVEAIASSRPYRHDFSIDDALAEIEKGSGIIYDKEVAQICLRVFREKMNTG